MTRILNCLLLILVGLLLCAAPVLADEINLSVAASMKEAINELADGFAKAHPGVKILKNFGGSGTLAKQIENGAPADIFISANREWMDYLKGKRLVDEKSIDTFAFNVLVFAGPVDKKAATMQDLAKFDRIAVGSPKSVPAGEYAMEALKKAGLDRQVGKKLVMARDVRECLMYAERGEVDGAFVYRTDALLLGRRTKIHFTVPQELYGRVMYPMGLTVSGARNAGAQAFFRFLQSVAAKNVLARYGFEVK